MPKENINDRGNRDFRVEVSWSPDAGYVQIATVHRKTPATMPGDDPGDPDQPLDGWHATLDRDGINRTIRALRKARDAAFGRDE